MLEKLWFLQKAIYQELKATPDLMIIIKEIHNIQPEISNFPYIVFNFDEINFIPTKSDKKISLKLIFKIWSNETTNQNLLKVGFIIEQLLPSINFLKYRLEVSLIKILNVKFAEEQDKQILTLSFNILL